MGSSSLEELLCSVKLAKMPETMPRADSDAPLLAQTLFHRGTPVESAK
jgi:hypothetical protein